MEDDLILATWALVAATGLLVVTAAIPLVRDILDRRERRRARASALIPDMHILRSRVEGSIDRLAHVEGLTAETVERYMEHADEDLHILAPVLEAGERPSLEFVNELYIARHLLTFARSDLHVAVHLFDEETTEAIRERDEALRRACRSYRAALATLDAAEELLPKDTTTIKGERFWDRFARVSDERERAAEHLAIDAGEMGRTTRRAGR